MRSLLKHIEGDRVLWAIAALLALFSFMPVYSASSNLAYLYGGEGNTFSFLFKHAFHLFLGFMILYAVHKIPYRYFRGLSILFLPFVILLLIITLSQGTTIGGANASRWIRIPVVGVTFQTSTLASVVLFTFIARYMAKMANKTYTFSETILPLWLPVLGVVALILPANFSTAAIVFVMSMMLVFIGGYPIKYILIIFAAGALFLSIFILAAKAYPGAFPNRVDTWISRIENFTEEDETNKENYQIERAKIAIATGGIIGQGPGKSIQKNFLPQSSSDFIYAIIVEEFGLIGAALIMFLYLMILFRLIILSHKCEEIFGKLLILGVGIPIVFQALINMAVAVELFPVTGQTLPLISSGGSSIWMTCMALGIIISVSVKKSTSKKAKQDSNIDDEINPLDILSEAQ